MQPSPTEEPARYAPELPLPPYAFVPGRHPHPVSDPRGHSHGRERPPADPPRLDLPCESRAFLHGVDLFNRGFYWEAHEAWESLWLACGRRGGVADLLKGLIKLAAAGVKSREGSPDGVARHARRAAEIFTQAHGAAPGADRLLGLDVRDLGDRCRALAADPPVDRNADPGPRPALGVVLSLAGR